MSYEMSQVNSKEDAQSIVGEWWRDLGGGRSWWFKNYFVKVMLMMVGDMRELGDEVCCVKQVNPQTIVLVNDDDFLSLGDLEIEAQVEAMELWWLNDE
ncbi:hypothetical protein Tco_1214857 [Tanacetum coccineum]